MSKRCPGCGETKPLDEFYNKKDMKDGKRTYCKSCGHARMTEWREANPDKDAENHRRWNLKKRYGITVEQYDELFEAQGGRCACCGTDNPGRGNDNLVVDHCHDSEEVRGLLCHDCNLAIGYLGDNLDGVWQAMLYLVKHERVA